MQSKKSNYFFTALNIHSALLATVTQIIGLLSLKYTRDSSQNGEVGHGQTVMAEGEGDMGRHCHGGGRGAGLLTAPLLEDLSLLHLLLEGALSIPKLSTK